MAWHKVSISLLARAWFSLTAQERLFLAAIIFIALLGLTVRFFSLQKEDRKLYSAGDFATPAEKTIHEQRLHILSNSYGRLAGH